MRLRYVQAWVDSEGRAHHYFRRRGSPRVPLPGIPGSAEFLRAYQAALAAAPLAIGVTRSKPGSVAAAIAALFSSNRFFGAKSTGTKSKYQSVLQAFRNDFGELPIGSLPRKFIVALLDKKPPHSARTWLKALRCLCQFAIEHEWMREDPTQGIRIKIPKSDGHHTWTEDEILQFETFHPIGSKARLALSLGLYTVQRRGDVVHMGRQHIRDGWLQLKQEKTGKALALPIFMTELPAIIEASETGDLTFLITKTGKSYAANDFSEQFRKWCDDAGLPHCSFHGLRKAGCVRLAELGCSASEIAAWSGQSLREVERYTRAADQKRLAVSAMDRTANRSVKPEPTEVSNPLKVLGKK
jgi:integrase